MQLDLFRPIEEQLIEKQLSPWQEWWELHDWSPSVGGLCFLYGKVLEDNGDNYLHIFLKGYILKIDEKRQTCYCHFPQPHGCSWCREVTGTVELRDISPITEYGFNEHEWRIHHPLPNRFLTSPSDGAQPQ